MAENILINARNIVKKYNRGSEEVIAVNDISLQVQRGEFVAFTGPSGSGKTTLINILGCLDNPDSGELEIGGTPIFGNHKGLSETELTRIRRKYFGYIFQSFHLIPTLTVYENTILPFSFYKKESSKNDAAGILDMLGMKKRMNHFPSQLSGGEMQRVAIARALMNNPEILFADEPTGNLDHNRSMEIGKLLKELNKKDNLTVIMVTHNAQLAEIAGRIVRLQDGKIDK